MDRDLTNRILASGTLDDARLEIARAFDIDADLKARYAWSHQAIYETTTAFIAAHLALNPPDFRHRYNQINENLRAAGNQLEQCLARQDAIFQLEADCISAVIDALNSDRVFAIEAALLTSEAKANAKQIGADLPDAGQQVADKFEIYRKVFDFKQKFYSAKGGTFNYNERILFMRQLQADSIRSLIERLQSARVGLAGAGIVKLPKVPEWKADAANPLLDMVLWMRGALRQMETFSEKESLISFVLNPHHAYLATAEGAALTKEQVIEKLRAGGEDPFTFWLDKSRIESRTGLTGIKSIRVVAVSVGVVFGRSDQEFHESINDKDKRDRLAALDSAGRAWRSRNRFSVRIQPPAQRAELAASEVIEWKPDQALLDSSVPVCDVVDPADMAGVPAELCANLNPQGTWKIAIRDDQINSEWTTTVSGPNFADVSEQTKIKGLTLLFTVAITR